jgi:hypothetical protein
MSAVIHKLSNSLGIFTFSDLGDRFLKGLFVNGGAKGCINVFDKKAISNYLKLGLEYFGLAADLSKYLHALFYGITAFLL